jgi:membrane-bound metal-dependent hydrolase YbcI (DUF457 family)
VDNLTHTLFALTVARTPLARAGRGTTAALVVASNAPDVDFITLVRGPVTYLKWHRGPTHGPLGIVGLGILSAAVVWLGRRLYDRRASSAVAAQHDEANATFGMLVAVSIIGAFLHVLLDVPTSYGTRILSPFDWHWFAVDLMPIIDVYLLAALIAGFGFGRRSAAARQRNASIVLTLMAANYGVRAVSHAQALSMVPRLFGPTLARPCDPAATDDRAPLDIWPPAAAATATVPPTGTRCLIEAAAMPSFASPFRWQIVLHLSNAYELRDLDLLDARWRQPDDPFEAPWRTSLRYPNVWTPVVRHSAETDLGRVFLGFSRFPAARSAVDAHGVTTVRFTDVRFAGAGFALDQQRPGPDIFTATIRVGTDGQILQEHLGR